MSVLTKPSRHARSTLALAATWLVFGLHAGAAGALEKGVSETTVRIGGVMDLEGRSQGLGQGMKIGIEAALRGATVQGRRIDFLTMNDSYTPTKTVAATRELLARGVFAMLGNVGTPTAKVSLPVLAEDKAPAVGFFTGAGLLRPGVGDVVNFRASYVQETAAVIRSAVQAGVAPAAICAYVQNDAYGMAGVEGIKRALAAEAGTDPQTVARLEQILALGGDDPPRNGLGPVGVYRRNTFVSRQGFESLKSWEQVSGTPCQVVVTVGTYAAIARFAAYARFRGEKWIFSAVSFTGADNFRVALKERGVETGIIMTQVVPPLDSSLPIVTQARAALGDEFGYVSLEGYIVGRMWLKAMNDIQGPITRDAFLDAIRGRRFELGGLTMDFSDDNQGSDFVLLTHLTEDGYQVMNRGSWRELLGR
jgi:ABC-type branched-subunit amino acid transport system substrate-binding protein